MLGRVTRAEGFRLNPAKTAVLGRGARQQVLGAVVNTHPALARPDRARLRAVLHNCAVNGWSSQAGDRSRDEFRAHLLGRVAWVGSLHPDHGRRLRAIAERIDWG